MGITVKNADNLGMSLYTEIIRKEKKMITVELKDGEKQVGILMATEKVFKTGSKGFFGMGKIAIGEKRYQVQVQLVEIGSKPKSESDAWF
jgi:hypothetical protein